MKAIIAEQYGPPEILQLREVDRPVPKAGEVLVKVHATTVNRTDCGILWGKPFIVRFFTGLTKPKRPIPGTDFAGEVVALGEGVEHLQVGERVFSFEDNVLSSHAEYLTIAAEKVLIIPENIDFEQAAASVEGAHYAFNFINKVPLQSGQRVLVNGATGAIGSAALQFLKHLGVEVTAVCNTKNIELIRSLGADRVIDYEKEDFTQDDQQYHFVFDAVGKSTFGKCRRLLLPGGVYISSELGPGAQNPFLALLTPWFGKKKVAFPLPVDIPRSLRFIRELLASGAFRPVIDRRYRLEEIAEAYRYVASGQKTGNVIIVVGQEE